MIDTRFAYQRLQHTETECDGCGGAILESENRHETVNGIECDDCAGIHHHDPENIYGLPGIRQSIEEDRR